jgi:hypothetical protein
MSKLISRLFTLFNFLTNNLFTFNIRPKLEKDFYKVSNAYDHSELGVIIQGGIADIDFLIETIKLYKKKIFPGALIIVSTWSDESSIVFEKIKKLNLKIKLLISDKPDNHGIKNINLQILSTKNAVLWAQKNKIKYLIKTRTDQRIYATNCFHFLISILKIFPSISKKQKNRLIGISLNSFKRRLYGISDMFMFGSIEDMIKYWTPPLDERKYINYNNINSQLKYSKKKICEVYLMTKYLERINYSLKWTLQDSLKVYKNFFCIIDQVTIDLYWNKYNTKEDNWKSYKKNQLSEMKFKEWISLYNKRISH